MCGGSKEKNLQKKKLINKQKEKKWKKDKRNNKKNTHISVSWCFFLSFFLCVFVICVHEAVCVNSRLINSRLVLRRPLRPCRLWSLSFGFHRVFPHTPVRLLVVVCVSLVRSRFSCLIVYLFLFCYSFFSTRKSQVC